MMWRIAKYIQHLFHLRYRKGHGIHSPYVFEFVNGVIFDACKVQVPGHILSLHRELRRDRKLGSFVRRSSVSVKYGALLYRITKWFGPSALIELGSGLGISTLYLGSGSPRAPLYSIEGNDERAVHATETVGRAGLGLVQIHQGEMGEKLDELLPLLKGRFIAFVDGNHHYRPTIDYVRKLLEKPGEESVVVMDDIYWSRGMYAAWKEVISWPEVRISIDMFHMGILLLRRDLDKTHLKINF